MKDLGYREEEGLGAHKSPVGADNMKESSGIDAAGAATEAAEQAATDNTDGVEPAIKTAPDNTDGTTGTPGASRSANLVFAGAPDTRTLTAALRPAMERARNADTGSAPACIIITSTREQSVECARIARLLLDDRNARVVPVSSVARARRVIAAAPVAVVAGTATELMALRKEAALSLEMLRSLVIVGLDSLTDDGGNDALPAIFADLPSECMRIATLETETEDAAAFLEAHLRRARRVQSVTAGSIAPETAPYYVITSRTGRTETLRSLLDDIDPPSLVIIAQTDEGIRDAEEALRELGIAVDNVNVRVSRVGGESHTSLALFWEIPHTADALLRALESRPVAAIALLAPEELTAFRELSNGSARALTAPSRKATAIDRVQQVRTALRSTLTNGAGVSASELALVGPLLDSFDALEIAAAAIRLYEGARRETAIAKSRAAEAAAAAMARGRSAPPAPRGAPASPWEAFATTSEAPSTVPDSSSPESVSAGSAAEQPASGKQRIFLAVGKRDGIRPGDIVGAIANEANIPGDRIGGIDLFESFSLVELSAADASKAIEALESVQLRGRRLNAKLDDREGGDSGRSGGFGGRSGGFGGRGGDRDSRGGGRSGGFGGRSGGFGGRSGGFGGRSGGFGGDRGRSERSGGFSRDFGERGDRGDRGDRFSRGPRFGRDDSGPRRSFRDSGSGDRRPGGSGRGRSEGFGGGRSEGFGGGRRNDGDSFGGRGGPRGSGHSQARRAFSDRAPWERTEPRREWSERGERFKHSRRPSRHQDNEGDSEG